MLHFCFVLWHVSLNSNKSLGNFLSIHRFLNRNWSFLGNVPRQRLILLLILGQISKSFRMLLLQLVNDSLFCFPVHAVSLILGNTIKSCIQSRLDQGFTVSSKLNKSGRYRLVILNTFNAGFTINHLEFLGDNRQLVLRLNSLKPIVTQIRSLICVIHNRLVIQVIKRYILALLNQRSSGSQKM